MSATDKLLGILKVNDLEKIIVESELTMNRNEDTSAMHILLKVIIKIDDDFDYFYNIKDKNIEVWAVFENTDKKKCKEIILTESSLTSLNAKLEDERLELTFYSDKVKINSY